ncbi:hypothetical protein CMI37_33440 [Candidatus Pacearchaeota archaeon]|nr:hypothetical protein [Candidatus Pacearchaeota archaeon]
MGFIPFRFLQNIMNKQRIYTRLENINDSLHDLECRLESLFTERDRRELEKKRSKLIRERNKLKKRLYATNEE